MILLCLQKSMKQLTKPYGLASLCEVNTAIAASWNLLAWKQELRAELRCIAA